MARTAAVLIGALAALAVTVIASLVLGTKVTSLGELTDALGAGADNYLRLVLDSRINRTLVGILAGAALAIAGLLMQGVTRNPLADPGLLGINAGAAAALVTASAFFGVTGTTAAVWIAIPGALLAGLVVYALGAAGNTGAGIVRLLLGGAVVSAVLHAYTQAVTLSNPDAFDSYRFWVVGSLSGSQMSTVLAILPFIVIGLVIALLLSSQLNALALGSEAAVGLGVNTTFVRAAALLTGTVLAAAATAAVGPIAFIGLAVPHLVRYLAGLDFRAQVPVAILVGPTILLLADVLARTIVRPQELMVGVVTAFVGAPFLLLAVRKLHAA
ncbi:FecCD family ABC transporter permease [Cumulibacter soli]|uniref:FecCD family ABC transporter permease n=1 Tax=Cumulibacter soli TaxID=2546344 RepID=UPI001ABA7767|nr:iron chelate uptake ABC transporter family permease subunit [Cumulibacter soli]